MRNRAAHSASPEEGTTYLTAPRLTQWLKRLEGLPPTAQCVGLHLATQANPDGVIEDIDWLKLANSSGVGERTAKAALRDGDLITFGLVTRIERGTERVSMSPAFELHIRE